jgi:hypothetical protein
LLVPFFLGHGKAEHHSGGYVVEEDAQLMAASKQRRVAERGKGKYNPSVTYFLQ